MRAIAVDWSGARDGPTQRRTIWVAQANDGCLEDLSAGRTREATVSYLLELSAGRPCVIGLDFSFGFPAWWAGAIGAVDGPSVWERAETCGEQWLAECAPPFWGRPGRPRPRAGDRPVLRRTELDVGPGAATPKSIFQIGGAGSVGTGSIRGMAALIRLRTAGVAIWPFDPWPPTGPVAVEAYPRWCIGATVKSRIGARASHLATAWPELSNHHRMVATASPDAFDAACTALTISRSAAPDVERDDIDVLEGRIFPTVVCTPSVSGRNGS